MYFQSIAILDSRLFVKHSQRDDALIESRRAMNRKVPIIRARGALDGRSRVPDYEGALYKGPYHF
jgi:hypothetical protein